MSRKTLIICDLCGEEIKDPREQRSFEIKEESFSFINNGMEMNLIDAHRSCVRSLLQAKRENTKEVPNVK